MRAMEGLVRASAVDRRRPPRRAEVGAAFAIRRAYLLRTPRTAGRPSDADAPVAPTAPRTA